MKNRWLKFGVVVLSVFLAGGSFAAVLTVTDSFVGTTTLNNWNAFGDACLTASPVGASSSNTLTGVNPAAVDGYNHGLAPSINAIPICTGPNDKVGSGALRLTPAVPNPFINGNISNQNYQVGAIISNFTFPSNQGIQITFTSYTYGGNGTNQYNGFGGLSQGADGISFFLTSAIEKNGTVNPMPTQAGARGGSLGYSCSNINKPYEGIAHGYLGLGIDEYGVNLYSGDNTATGIQSTVDPGTQAQGNRIGLRGAGNINDAAILALSPNAKTVYVCLTGEYANAMGVQTPVQDYAAIPNSSVVLPDTKLIANDSAKSRSAATKIVYKIVISSNNILNLYYNYNSEGFLPVLTNQDITNQSGVLPATFRFGFASGTGNSTNVHEITCFSASPLVSNSSAGANTVSAGKVQVGSQLYLATYTEDNWWGTVVSETLVTDGQGAVTVSKTLNWDANCQITGGGCSAANSAARTPASRVLLTSSVATTAAPAAGEAFQFAALTSGQQSNLNSDSQGQNRLLWLRGDRTNEQLQPAPSLDIFRQRTQVMGDVINSSPSFVGAPLAHEYPDAFQDKLYGTASNSEAGYSTFVTNNSSRQSVVYAGSNDGFMHGFAADPAISSGAYVASANAGSEVIGFMPGGVVGSAGIVNLTSPLYKHQYFVDATPSTSDLFYGAAWHTWLVSGVGSGGSEIFALDITTPSNFAEGSAGALVMGDWNNAASGLSYLGSTVGSPIVARLHNGQWAIIFGNGLKSGTTAGIYVGLIDKTSGAVTFTFYDTKVGSSSSANGITYVTSFDLDGDNITDYLYAGDLQGNVWRMDMTSSTASDWGFSGFGNLDSAGKPIPTALFIAKDSSGTVQPITTKLVVSKVSVGGGARVIVMFGTGQVTTPATTATGSVYASGTQTVYGVWDWDMTAWNTKASATLLVLPESPIVTFDRSKLLVQTSTESNTSNDSNSAVVSYRYLSTVNVVCWRGSAACPAANDTQFGWLYDLPDAQEQIIYNPALLDTQLVVNTAIPPAQSPGQCNAVLQSGFTMAFDPGSGGALKKSFFADATGAQSATNNSVTIGGVQINAVGTPTAIVSSTRRKYLVSQTVTGTPAVLEVFLSTNPRGPPTRVSWKEVRRGW